MQKELIKHKRSDLINAIRIHGGVTQVRRALFLTKKDPKNPRGYWEDQTVLRVQLLVYMGAHGYAGLMPRREELAKNGRTDLCYAIEKYGGFAAVARNLDLVWHGPKSFWREFRNVQRRLMSFVKYVDQGPYMPTVELLYDHGRMDLVYAVMMHGGVMLVAKKLALFVKEKPVPIAYWEDVTNITNELTHFMRTRPTELRQVMPSSTTLIWSGRPDLARAIRDCGGWVYHAQRAGFRFGFDRRQMGFWESEQNVLNELITYVENRFGQWEHPGQGKPDQIGALYIPCRDMLMRDGRSDIAYAIQRYHEGYEVFADKHALIIAQDVMHVSTADVLMSWSRFAKELISWVEEKGVMGIMPTKNDLIRTGRHDLRFAMYRHGGVTLVAKKLGFIVEGDPAWVTKWLGVTCARLGYGGWLTWEDLEIANEDEHPKEEVGHEIRAIGAVGGWAGRAKVSHKKKIGKAELEEIRRRYKERGVTDDDIITI